MDKIAETSLLYDFYGQLLTEKQRQVMGLYHEENLSLTEIADEFMISRQAVHDTLKKAERSLAEYENKLGLVEKFVRTNRALEKIENEIDEITGVIAPRGGAADIGAGMTADEAKEAVLERLQRVKVIIEELEEG